MKYWLHDKIEPILKASGVISSFEIAQLIEAIAENELYELWVEWMDEQKVTWESKDKKSFVLWLKKKA